MTDIDLSSCELLVIAHFAGYASAMYRHSDGERVWVIRYIDGELDKGWLHMNEASARRQHLAACSTMQKQQLVKAAHGRRVRPEGFGEF